MLARLPNYVSSSGDTLRRPAIRLWQRQRCYPLRACARPPPISSHLSLFLTRLYRRASPACFHIHVCPRILRLSAVHSSPLWDPSSRWRPPIGDSAGVASLDICSGARGSLGTPPSPGPTATQDCPDHNFIDSGAWPSFSRTVRHVIRLLRRRSRHPQAIAASLPLWEAFPERLLPLSASKSSCIGCLFWMSPLRGGMSSGGICFVWESGPSGI